MNLVTKVRIEGRNVVAAIPELRLLYEPVALEMWQKAGCSLFDRQLPHPTCDVYGAEGIDPLLNRLGGEVVMGRPRSVYYHQAKGVGKHLSGYNFTETLLGRVLLDQFGYPAERIVYENWRVSAKTDAFFQATATAPPKGPGRASGTRLVMDSFTSAFFEDMATLMDLNGASHEANLDLFASNPIKKECGFFEAKRDDQLEDHQRRLLGFVAYLSVTRASTVLVDPRTLVRAGVIRFVTILDREQERQDAYDTHFEVPEEWTIVREPNKRLHSAAGAVRISDENRF